MGPEAIFIPSNSTLDAVFEDFGAGYDTVNASATYTLAANIEVLVLTGVLAINGTGNGLANTLTGNGASNRLNGGIGDDRLTGAAGADFFEFSAASGADRITDFTNNVDTLVFDDALWTGVLTVQQVITNFATIAAGAAVFTFGDGTRVTVDGVTNLNSLVDDISFI